MAATRVALTYGALATVWILLSDRAALALFGDASQLTWVQTGKGLAFVASSALLIFVLISRERRRWAAAERAEHRSALRFEAIFRASPAGILITDIATRTYLDANERLLTMFGYRRSEVVGRTLDDVEFWADPERRGPLMDRLRKDGRLLGQVSLFRHADGRLRTILWSAELLVLEGRESILAAMVDLTDRTEAYEQTLTGWARALELRDQETAGHTERVADLAVALGARMGLGETELQALRWGALLHDIGKIAIPDAILTKTGPLDEKEWAIMRSHPQVARELLEPIDFLADAVEVPAFHHERWDGSGYPEGRAGEAIPLAARIFAVVDVWDALTSDRPYFPSWPRERAVAYLREEAGRLFDPAVVTAFLALLQATGLDEIPRGAPADQAQLRR